MSLTKTLIASAVAAVTQAGTEGLVPAAAVPTGGSCAYALAYAPLSMYGFQEPTMSNGDQTMTVALADGANNFGALSYPATVDASTGTKVVRLAIGTMTAVAVDGTDGDFKIELSFLSAEFVVMVSINVTSVIGGFVAYANGGVGVGDSSDPLVTPPAYLDIRFRAADSAFDVVLPDGTVVGSNLAYTPQAFNPMMTVAGTITGTAIGDTQVATLVTDATTLANSPFAVLGGSTDACGNAI